MGIEATNLTICVPYRGCDKNCEYCVSKMTGYTKTNINAMYRNLDAVIKTANNARVFSVIFTGKGEPFLNRDFLFNFLYRFKDFPTEIQTNGKFLNTMLSTQHKDDYLKLLTDNYVNVIAFSIDQMATIDEYNNMFKLLDDTGIMVRVCINVTAKLGGITFNELFHKVKETTASQILVRKVSVPDKVVKSEEAANTMHWINAYAHTDLYTNMHDEYTFMLHRSVPKGSKIRELPHGAVVWELDDISVCFSDYCIQEANNTKDIRSLIWEEDGSVRTSWGKPGSKLF